MEPDASFRRGSQVLLLLVYSPCFENCWFTESSADIELKMGSAIKSKMERRRGGGKEGDRTEWSKTEREAVKEAATKKEYFLLLGKYRARAAEWGWSELQD